MYLKCLSVIIALVTLLNIGKSKAEDSIYNIPLNDRLINYDVGIHSSKSINNSSQNKSLERSRYEDYYRLPGTVIPYLYDISIFLKNDFKFHGLTKINATIETATNKIVLHHGNITIDKITITLNDKKVNITDDTYDPVTEKLTIKLEKSLEKNTEILIAIDYDGEVKDNLIGFYKSSYFNKNGDLTYLAATQFQAVHARQAFPCFDEPSFKAKFKLKIRKNSKFKCLSNMPISESKDVSAERSDVFFKESLTMSTYLVGFVISDLESKGSDGFNVWATKELIDQGDYALSIGKKSISFFEKTFNQMYPMEKMDMVAVPDFAAGAMENWGLILYREAAMLYHKDESSDVAQQRVAVTIVHECTHMWFGNLVTPHWWGFLWLSEGFATYYEYMATAKIETTWNMEEQFLVAQHQVALSVDGLTSSQPLTRIIASQSEIGESGDKITYSKGASVLRMMEMSFGSPIFDDALKNYLESRKYQNAKPEDLWMKIQKEIDSTGFALKTPIETLMNSWTKQAGFPVVSISIKEGKATLRQNRFLLRNPKAVSINSVWWIPISWATKSNHDFSKTVTNQWIVDNTTINVNLKKNDWIVFNVKSAGFYRVNYDKELWYRIIDTLNVKERIQEINVLNRAAIIDDLMNLARADYLDYNVALDGLKYLMEETHYLPNKAAISALDYLTKRFSGQEEYDIYVKFILTLIDKTYRKLSYDDKEGDNRLTILLRRELNEMACSFNHERCIEKSFEYFHNWRSGSLKMISKNQKLTAYKTAMKNATETDWNALWDRYVESNVPSEQLEILQALGCNKNRTILERYLLWAISSYKDHRIRKQDSKTVFNAVSSCSLFGAEFIIDFINMHYKKIIDYNDGDVHSISNILSEASNHFSTQELIDKFEKLISSHKKEFESIIPSLESQLELAKWELEWYKKHKKTIVDWINEFTKKEDTSATTDYLLPDTISPTKYYIHVIPYIKEGNFNFDGTVEIETTVVKDVTDKIVLHIFEMKYHNINILVNGTSIAYKRVTYSEIYQFLTITLPIDILEGTQVKISINYTGYLNNEMRGFYRSSYKDDEGITRWLATTHLEPVGARRMFPCFDEPAMKAIFVISVTRPKSYHAISNMPIDFTIDVTDDLQKDTFKPTPRMSTYLVALIVSQFANQANKEHKVWARPNAIFQANYSLAIMTPILKFFETTLQHKYQLPKLDMVAVPDFSAGAMENWGLITYREKRMLYDPKESSVNDKQAICLVIAHEITHQWFGDLVSPQWWKYLWLNEGFARYLQYAGCAEVHKAWKLPAQFVVDHLQTSFGTDGVGSSDPITNDVYNPSQISGRFNAISYAKAASILRMTEKILGSKIFYQSLHNYLEARQYDFATPEHLYKALQDQVDVENITLGVGIKPFLDSWTLKAGFPVVSVKVSGEKFTFSQERFLIKNEENYPINQTWWIPITWTTQTENDFSNTVPKYWLSDASNEISIAKKTNDWIIFNIQEAGYYRVNYDSDNWLRIINTLKSPIFGTIHEINRAAVIDDLFNLARSGYVSYDKVLSATQYLKRETNYLAWKAAFNGLSYLNKRFAGRDIYEIYRIHILTILQPIFEKLGSTEIIGEDYYDTLLRILVIEWACKFEHPECLSYSQKLFADWRKDASKIVPVNQRKTIYCTVIKQGTKDDWNFLFEQYLNTDFASEKTLILQALSCSKNPELLNKLLTQAVTIGSEIRFQDSQKIFTYVYQSSLVGVETVLEFLKNNYGIMQKYYLEEKAIKTILNGVSQRLSTKELMLKMQDIVTAEQDSWPLKISLKSYLARAHYEFMWYDKYTPKIWEWLEKTYPSADYRLPKIVKPLSYNIRLRPYLEDKNFTFEGEVKISMQTLQNTSRIILQANELKIQDIKVFDASGKSLDYFSFVMNTTTHRLSIYLKTTIGAGNKMEASFKYSGFLNDEMEGFYRSWYTDKDGKTRWLATTQFQPTHARKAFPCFDEPSFKAKFTVQIERSNYYHSRSNMPLKSIEKINDEVSLDIFEESPLMSSYLVAFVVSNFTSHTVNQNFSIWTRPDINSEISKYSLLTATELLKILESTTGINYILPKMDLVAIPDFKAGAMENWGLVTFREYGLLYHDRITPATYKKYINTTIAHEFVHMWFGDLVTCDWWDYTWLNEGFAQYFSYISTNTLIPSWDLLDQFVVYELHRAMASDASEKSHPMNNIVSSPAEIASGFDNIAYKKGASVIRMMYHSFGPKIFNSSIQNYLKQRQFQTAKPEHLWQSIQVEADQTNLFDDMNVSIQELMDSWTNQPGHPVVNVTFTNGKMVLTQEQFLLSKNNSSPTNRNYWIPITYTRESNSNFIDTSPIIWFGNSSMVLDVDMKDEWFILNLQEVGFYRVNYDVKSWYRLINLLNSDRFKIIHIVNRAQIINDVLNLAHIGYVNYTLALDATAYMINEDNHLPWMSLLSKFSDFRTRFQGHEINDRFALHIRTILQKIYEKLGFIDFEGESQLTELNRALILKWACYYQKEDCVAKSKDLFLKWRQNSLRISPNARPAVYCTAMEHGTYEDWQFLWNEYLSTDFASEQVVILEALACTKNKTMLNTYLQLILESDKIRRQDAGFAFTAVYSIGKVGLETCLQFLMKNYNSVYSYFRNWNDVGSMFSNVAAYISTSEQFEELENFINKNSDKLKEILPALQSAVAVAKQNQQWFDTYSPEIYAWLERYQQPNSTKTTPKPDSSSQQPNNTETTPNPDSSSQQPNNTETTPNPDSSSPPPPSPGGSHDDGSISIHWIIALIFLLLLSIGVVYKICS